MRVRVVIQPGGKTVVAEGGEPVLRALRRAGAFLDASCGGEGRCGRCAITTLAGDWTPPDDEETRRGSRLACRAGPLSDVALRLSATARRLPWAPAPFLPAPDGPLFLALDVGTTTLSAALAGADGAPFAELRALNPQGSWGSDVLRRLAAAADPDQGAALRDSVRAALKALAGELLARAAVDPARVGAFAAAGNGAMAVLLLGLDPGRLSVAPFATGLEAFGAVGLDPGLFGLGPSSRGFLVPGIGSFVGGDVTAGILASGLHRGPRPALFLDAGTNGEIVLAPERGPLLAASAAAGPAFEGGHLSCGGPALEGAVLDAEPGPAGSLRLEILGAGAPRWICGSGALRLAARLLDARILEPNGRLDPRAAGVGEEGGERYFSLYEEGATRLRFTQGDVRELQLAVGAIRAGWRILLDRAGLEAGDLERIVVTGAFGNALDAAAARRIGLLPDVERAPEVLPSGAARGLLRAAAGLDAPSDVAELVRRAVHVPLGDERFQQIFLDSLTLAPFAESAESRELGLVLPRGD